MANKLSFGSRKSVSDNFNLVKSSDTGSIYKIVPYDEIEPNSLNDYPITEIEKIKEEIREFGLISPLGLIPNEPGEGKKKYRLFSGERRYTAIGELLKEGDTLFVNGIPCTIDNKVLNKVDEEIKLILANTQREMPTELKRKKALRLSELYKMKEKNDGIKLNITKLIAADLGIGERQVQKINKINNTLIPELKVALDSSKININKAAELASLPEEDQKDIAEMIEDTDVNLNKTDINTLQSISKEVKQDNKNNNKVKNKGHELGALMEQIRKPLNKLLIVSNEMKSSHSEIPNELKDFYSELYNNVQSLQRLMEEH